VGIGGKRYVVVSLDRHRRKSLRRGIFHTHADTESEQRKKQMRVMRNGAQPREKSSGE
jgi:hypothetical protein